MIGVILFPMEIRWRPSKRYTLAAWNKKKDFLKWNPSPMAEEQSKMVEIKGCELSIFQVI